MTLNYKVKYKDGTIETGLVKARGWDLASLKVQRAIWPREWASIKIDREGL